MTEEGIFARLLAEKQSEIDKLKAERDALNSVLVRFNKKLTQFMGDAIYFLNYPTDKNRPDFRQAIQRMGWCVRCEENPCACQEHDY